MNKNVKNSEESEILCHLQDSKFTWPNLMDTGKRHGTLGITHGSANSVCISLPEICINLPCPPKYHRAMLMGPDGCLHTEVIKAGTCLSSAPERGFQVSSKAIHYISILKKIVQNKEATASLIRCTEIQETHRKLSYNT